MTQNEEAGKTGKVEVAEWPATSGDFEVGKSKGCVAVVTLATAAVVKELAALESVAICGECKTENVGIEKVILNVISNPNIRFLLVCGVEVAGHVTGGCFKAIWEFEFRAAWIIVGKELMGRVPEQIHLVAADSLLSLATGASR